MNERDPATIYGPLPPQQEQELKSGVRYTESGAGIRDLVVQKSEFQRVPPKRVLTLTLQIEATEVHAGLQLSQQIAYNSLASPQQVDAIVEALTDLDFRLGLALGILRITPDYE